MMDATAFHNIANKLLQELAEKLENRSDIEEADYLQGILNLEFSDGRAYVLNKHEPTRQIWLSSPVSGAHKFRYNEGTSKWTGHDGEDLQELLNSELK